MKGRINQIQFIGTGILPSILYLNVRIKASVWSCSLSVIIAWIFHASYHILPVEHTCQLSVNIYIHVFFQTLTLCHGCPNWKTWKMYSSMDIEPGLKGEKWKLVETSATNLCQPINKTLHLCRMERRGITLISESFTYRGHHGNFRDPYSKKGRNLNRR